MILTAILVLSILGFIFAGLLALAADYFKVEEDPRVKALLAILPGSNCGACGEAGCHALAEKLAKGEASIDACVSGGVEVAEKLAQVMEVSTPAGLCKNIAVVHCGAKEKQRKIKAVYHGVKTCAGSEMVSGGGLACSYGCLGYGDCFCVCPFDAIRMEEGLPHIDIKKCTACGKCVSACPRDIIEVVPCGLDAVIACSSRDTAGETRKNCPVGCIACRICEKAAPEVFKVEDNLAKMDYSKTGVNCSAALEKCPTKCILAISVENNYRGGKT